MTARRRGESAYEEIIIERDEPEVEIEGVETERFSYRDKDGRLMGRTEAGFGPVGSFKIGSQEYQGREITSLLLRGRGREGGKVAFDALALRGEPFRIIAATGREPNYYCHWETRTMVVPEPRTPVDLAVLRHEIGHAEQYFDPRTAKYAPFYGAKRRSLDPLGELRPSWLALSEAICTAEPRIEVAADSSIRQLIRLTREKWQLERAAERIKGAIADLRDQRGRLLGEFADNYGRDAFDRVLATYFVMPRQPGTGRKTSTPEQRRAFLQACDEQGITVEPQDREELVEHPEALADAIFELTGGRSSDRWDVSQRGDQVDFQGAVRMGERLVPVQFSMRSSEAAAELLRKTAGYLDRELEAQREQLRGEEQALAANGRELREAPQPPKERVLELLDLPRKLLERDATRRALIWADEAKEIAGVDLFRPHIVPKRARALRPDENCAASVDRDLRAATGVVETTIEEDLDDALTTYRAQGPELLQFED